MSWRMHHGDCREVMASMDADSVDAIVSDPPYGLAFMGKGWDHAVPGVEFWAEALRVAKPGAHLVAFGGTRTFHRLACAIEDAGWEMRDCLSWLYGNGFPKSHDVSKAMDKAAGAEREVVSEWRTGRSGTLGGKAAFGGISGEDVRTITAPATNLARQWSGWGTALKPAYEPIILARKPLAGTVAANVQSHGTGALNVDGCRVGTDGGTAKGTFPKEPSNGTYGNGINGACEIVDIGKGRWPANVLLDEDAAAQVGEPSRFFYTAKASGREREAGLDRTCTVKHITSLCETDNEALVASLRRATSDTPTVSWLTDESGESIMGLCPSDSLSTTLTAISKITTSEICNWWTPLHTSESTEDASWWTASGGSRAESAKSANPLNPSTTSDGTASALGASGVVSTMLSTISDGANWKPLTNVHSTVKPIALMRWLCRLVTPPGGVVLDPFTGSGTTGCAAVLEGFGFVGIEQDAEYVAIAEARIAHWEYVTPIGLAL
jgi:hypothetical protein